MVLEVGDLEVAPRLVHLHPLDRLCEPTDEPGVDVVRLARPREPVFRLVDVEVVVAEDHHAETAIGQNAARELHDRTTRAIHATLERGSRRGPRPLDLADVAVADPQLRLREGCIQVLALQDRRVEDRCPPHRRAERAGERVLVGMDEPSVVRAPPVVVRLAPVPPSPRRACSDATRCLHPQVVGGSVIGGPAAHERREVPLVGSCWGAAAGNPATLRGCSMDRTVALQVRVGEKQ